MFIVKNDIQIDWIEGSYHAHSYARENLLDTGMRRIVSSVYRYHCSHMGSPDRGF